MQRAKENNSRPVRHGKNKFFQKPRNTPRTSKPEPKSTRAAEETGNEFFLKPSATIPEQSARIDAASTAKKPFDKKSWRLQKYSKKYKLDQWESRRKKTVLREYYRQIDPNEKKLDVQTIYEQYDDEFTSEITTEENDNDNNANAHNSQCSLIVDNVSNVNNYSDKQIVVLNIKTGKRKNAFMKAHDELARMKEEKRVKKEDFLRKKQEKEEKLKLYKQKKTEKFKRLNKKTKRGQPVMKDRMEMLLEQIQKNL